MGSFFDIDAWLASALVDSSERAAVPVPCPLDEQVVQERIVFHAIAPLLFSRFDPVPSWPDAIAAKIREEAMLQALWEPSHRAAVQGALAALCNAGVEALVMKGTALAYSAYRAAQLRRRGDSDLLVREADLDAARLVMRTAMLSPSCTSIGSRSARNRRAAGSVTDPGASRRAGFSPELQPICRACKPIACRSACDGYPARAVRPGLSY